MEHWTESKCRSPEVYTAGRVRAQWQRLHSGDLEPLPSHEALLDGWVSYHNGDFEAAARKGLSLGLKGMTLANQASCIYATYVEPSEKRRLDMLIEVAERALLQQRDEPGNPNAWYWHAYALGRFSQGVSVAKGLAQGLGERIVRSLRETIRLSPRHPNAHLALARFHAEVIDKVGSLVGGMTYGANQVEGMALYRKALDLCPSLITLHECAAGWLMVEGENGLTQAESLRQRAESYEPADAMEALYVESIRADLAG
ncbi:hypothetical protein [Hydrogenophaga sp. 5NK40-0174]|uniref:hypothetical protein n=1 Tax=Hydrogenophaga sp. 5NK40-0174 TaxID=3127649 RepID=UPI00310836B6